MAGLTLAERDLVETRERLVTWFENEHGETVSHSELRLANESVGWSSESLLFVVFVEGEKDAREFVIRIPPSGGGLYREYDLDGQTRTQQLLHEHGIAAPSPVRYEPDGDW